MKICFVCSEYPPGPHGGIGTATRILAQALADRGHEVRVVGVYPPSYPAADRESDGAVHVLRLREPRGAGGWVRARRQLYRVVREWVHQGSVDLVEAPDYGGAFAGWPRLPVPLVIRLNGSATYFAAELGRKLAPVTRVLEANSFRRADEVCSASQYTANVSRGLFGFTHDVTVLYNPVDPPTNGHVDEATEFAEREAGTVVFSGTLTAKKGVISLIDAWSLVRRQRGDARLILFGKDGRASDGGSMREHLESRLPADSRGSVMFRGHVSREEVYDGLRTARVAVFPSYSEAFALAPLEAMATGCPTIYSTVGSGPELIDHGSSGLLVDPASPTEIADAILRLLGDDGLARHVAREGRRCVRERFHVDALVERNEEFYRKSVATFQSRRAGSGR